jgi:hypothetical protein
VQRLQVALSEGLRAQAFGLGHGRDMLVCLDGLEHDAEVARMFLG